MIEASNSAAIEMYVYTGNCPACLRGFFPVEEVLGYCPACHRGSVLVRGDILSPVELIQVVPSRTRPDYETWAKMCVNRDGNFSREEREEAMLKLFDQFRYLIKKTSKTVYFKYKKFFPHVDESDFEHEVLTIFFELTLEYFPVDDGGPSPFAPYINGKLFYRTLYLAQKEHKILSHHIPTDAFDLVENHELESVISHITGADEEILDDMRQEQINQLARDIRTIAADDILDEKEKTVFNMYYCSGNTVREIIEHLNEQGVEQKGMSQSRIWKIVKTSRGKIMTELARRKIASMIE